MEDFNQMLLNIKCAFITLLGEKYQDRIIQAFQNIGIYEYETTEEAESLSDRYFNNGKNYKYSALAMGGGITEDDYYTDELGNVNQKIIVLISKGEYNEQKIQILVHEICHALSLYGSFRVEENQLYVKNGVVETRYEFDGNFKGKIISDKNVLYNEIITENLAAQVMDVYNDMVKHHAVSYQGAAEDFRSLFRNENLNPVIIEDYMSHNPSNNFINALVSQISQEEYQNVVQKVSTNYDLNNESIRNYFANLYDMPVNAFFNHFVEYFNRLSRPQNMDRSIFKIVKSINRSIIRELGNELEIEKSYS